MMRGKYKRFLIKAIVMLVMTVSVSESERIASSYFYHKIHLPLRYYDDEVTSHSPHGIHIHHHQINDYSHNDGLSHLISRLMSDPYTNSISDSHFISRDFDEDDGESSSSPPTLWPHASIPFVIDEEVDRYHHTILRAMSIIEKHSCVRFKARRSERDFIVIKGGDGCYSSVGKKGGPQVVALGTGCHSLGIILHELMHVVGFYHLHQRPDRDRFLNIHWDNINPSFINNFKLLSSSLYRVSGDMFDYASIMMYGPTSFSRHSSRVTMTPTRSGVTLRDPAYKHSLSQQDIRSINSLYQCYQSNHIAK